MPTSALSALLANTPFDAEALLAALQGSAETSREVFSAAAAAAGLEGPTTATPATEETAAASVEQTSASEAAPAPAPAAPSRVFAACAVELGLPAASSLPTAALLQTLQRASAGAGEATLRYALRAGAAVAGAAEALDEAGAWSALTRAAAAPLDGEATRAALRRAWRLADKATAAAGPPRVLVDSFADKVVADELLGALLAPPAAA